MYQELKKKLIDIYNSEDVVSDDKVISAYDLIKATNRILKPWYTLKLKKTYIDRINEKYQQKNKSLKQLKAFVTGEFESKVFIKGVMGIHTFNEEKGDNLIFHQSYPIVLKLFYTKHRPIVHFRIGKYLNSDEIFLDSRIPSDYTEFEKQVINDFINDNLEIIYELFGIMEEYYQKFGLKEFGNTDSKLINNVNDGFFDITLNATDGKVQYKLNLFSEEDNDNLCREWIGLESLKDILKTHEKTYLKKIMIPVSNLNDFYQKVVKLTYGKDKVKTL